MLKIPATSKAGVITTMEAISNAHGASAPSASRALSTPCASSARWCGTAPGATWGHPLRAFGVVRFCFLYLIEAQRHAQYRGRFAFVRQVECAHKTKPRGELQGYKGRILGLLACLVWSLSLVAYPATKQKARAAVAAVWSGHEGQ